VTNIARVKSVSVLQGADRVQNRAQGPGSKDQDQGELGGELGAIGRGRTYLIYLLGLA